MGADVLSMGDRGGDAGDTFEETAVDRIAALLHDVAGGERAEVNVYRITDQGMEFCCKLTPEEFEQGGLELVSRRFGSGQYEIRLYGTAPGSKKFAVRGKTRVTIAQDRGPVAAAAPAAGPQDSLTRVLEQLAIGQQQMAAALADRAPVEPVDPLAQVRTTIELMTLMRGVTGEQQRSPVSEIVAAVRELRGAAGELMPEKDKPVKEDTLIELVRSVMPVITAAVQARPGPGGMPPVSMPPALPGPAASPAAAVPDPEPVDDEQQQELVLRVTLSTLVKLASVKKPSTTIEAGAELVYENVPEQFLEFLRGDEWFSLLTQIAPEVEPHKAWLEKVRARTLEIDAEEKAGEKAAAATESTGR